MTIPSASSASARARMDGQHQRSFRRRDAIEQGGPGPERVRLAVLGPVDRRKEVGTRLELEPRNRPGEATADVAKGGVADDVATDPGRQVLHQVADEDDAVLDTLGSKVVDRGRCGGEEPPRQVVGHDPVDLLGHPPVEAPQPGLDVRDRHAELGRGECARQR